MYPNHEDIVEVINVGLNSAHELIYLADGQRLVRRPEGDCITFDEFQTEWNMSVAEYLESVGSARRDALTRALEVVRRDIPFPVEVTCSNREEGHTISTRTILVYDLSQIRTFELRHGLCVLDKTHPDLRKEL